ncbi:S-adenosyl-L-methionine-dependent methyltransferase [Nemania sp. FL0031]|nr:S-adenosyl-L-methionine-dependent methyltransferase [Nemania sp. FL0031]
MAPGFLTRTSEAFLGLLNPWAFLYLSASFIPQTLRHLAREQGLISALATLFFAPSRFREAWFGQFWSVAGPGVRERTKPSVLPLLDGRTSGGRVLDTPVGPGISGVVIEIGPASGLWVEVFSDRHLYEDDSVEGPGASAAASVGKNASGEVGSGKREKRANTARGKITRVYGVEPNTAHHPALRRAVAKAGLEDVYEIVPVGIEDLSSASDGSGKKKWEGNIEPGSVDCIVSVLCLCSIPDPEQHIRELYQLLRPGGRWYALEHVRAEYSWYIRAYQRFVNIAWPVCIGGCQLCRQTGKSLKEAGPWTSIDIGQPPAEPWYQLVPHILGVYTK